MTGLVHGVASSEIWIGDSRYCPITVTQIADLTLHYESEVNDETEKSQGMTMLPNDFADH
jgi:hypothetical protein